MDLDGATKLVHRSVSLHEELLCKSVSCVAFYIARFLILPQPHKSQMPQVTIGGPLDKLELPDYLLAALQESVLRRNGV
jgi:hypothetical protein